MIRHSFPTAVLVVTAALPAPAQTPAVVPLSRIPPTEQAWR